MKKILLLDDQKLILLYLQKALTILGYKVITSNNVADAIVKFDMEAPHLVIVDINMTNSISEAILIEHSSGLEVINHIKNIKKDNTPVMVLSGNTDEDVISKGFDLGIEDYMKKPLSLNEIGARVKRLIGSNEEIYVNETSVFDAKQQYIPNKHIGVVIPFYNEDKRFLIDEYISFAHKNLGYYLCFVNDGSNQKNQEKLEQLRKGKEDYISIYNCEKNSGKSEAVRLGMLHLATQNHLDYIGFLDADLTTNFDDFENLANTIYNSKYKLVFGSRIARMGADSTKESARAIVSKAVNFFNRQIIGMEINDSKCGAKIMTKDLVNSTFIKKFKTEWLFDVEIFLRIKKLYGIESTKKLIYEKPLNRWIHNNGSKLSNKDSFKIVGQTVQIALHYN